MKLGELSWHRECWCWVGRVRCSLPASWNSTQSCLFSLIFQFLFHSNFDFWVACSALSPLAGTRPKVFQSVFFDFWILFEFFPFQFSSCQFFQFRFSIFWVACAALCPLAGTRPKGSAAYSIWPTSAHSHTASGKSTSVITGRRQSAIWGDIPRHIEAYRDISRHTGEYRGIPGHIKAYRDISRHTGTYRGIPRNVEAYRDISRHT